MSVESAQLYPLTVEIKSVVFKSNGSESEAQALFVNDLAAAHCANTRRVQSRGVQAPKLCIRNAQLKRLGAGRGNDLAAAVNNICSNAFAFAFDPHSQLVQTGVLDKNFFDIRGILYLERHLAVKSAVAQIVNNKAKRRNVKALARVEPNIDYVFAAEINAVGYINGKRRVAAGVISDTLSVAENSCLVRSSVKAQYNPLALPLRGSGKALSVAADHLIVAAVDIVIRYLSCRVRQTDGGCPVKACVVVLGKKPAVIESNVHIVAPSNF